MFGLGDIEELQNRAKEREVESPELGQSSEKRPDHGYNDQENEQDYDQLSP